MANQINAATFALNTASEQCRLTAYDDKQPDHVLKPGDPVLGTLSIGYDHTGLDVYVGMTCSQADADAWRMADLETAEAAVRAATPASVALTDNQFGALSDFVYNVGAGNFATSTIRKLLLRGKVTAIVAEFSKWVFAKGVREPGLVRRRAQEAHLFMTPDPVKQKTLLTSATAAGIVAAGTVPLLAQPLQDTASQLVQFQDVAPFIPKFCHYIAISDRVR